MSKQTRLGVDFARVVLGTTLAIVSSHAQDTLFPPVDQQIPAPPCLSQLEAWNAPFPGCSAEAHAEWLKDISRWRMERLIRVGYNGERYATPALSWTQSSFIQPQLMVQDRDFYDPITGKYTVERYLNDLKRRYGGIDAVLIWPTYPNLGIDSRNQHDMIRAMPGGVAGVREMVASFHHLGVRVLFPMMMWDQGTRDPGQPWPDAFAALMNEIGADGVNGDTQEGVPLAFSLAAEKVGHPLAFQPEDSPHDEGLAWNVMTWGQYKTPFVPQVDRFKWLETRHMVNISDRWNRSKTDDLQFAFFNGVGWESWENIWGIWNGITPRDAEATRRMATIERGIALFLVSKNWEPHAPMRIKGIFGSRWPLQDKTAWTIVNRNEYDVSGMQMIVPLESGLRYFDLYHGVELTPERDKTASGEIGVLSFAIEAHGYGAILSTHGDPDLATRQLMSHMHRMTFQPLSNFSDQWQVVPQQLAQASITERAALRTNAIKDQSGDAPEGMTLIPAGDYIFKVQGIEIEGRNEQGVDVEYAWEDSPRRFHEHRVHMDAIYMDTHPVTNADFKRFIDGAHYHPQDDFNFLRDWKEGSFPAGWAKKPVTWISLEDARSYATWAGKRLPHEWEWQFAAQGSDGRPYPWGDAWDPAAVPSPGISRSLRGPDDVDRHPKGASPFGVVDMVGNVWQFTDEYVDEHTRAVILRGGSYYQPQGSLWYFPQAYRNDQHGKLLLMAPGYDRSGTVGFRCVRDMH